MKHAVLVCGLLAAACAAVLALFVSLRDVSVDVPTSDSDAFGFAEGGALGASSLEEDGGIRQPLASEAGSQSGLVAEGDLGQAEESCELSLVGETLSPRGVSLPDVGLSLHLVYRDGHTVQFETSSNQHGFFEVTFPPRSLGSSGRLAVTGSRLDGTTGVFPVNRTLIHGERPQLLTVRCSGHRIRIQGFVRWDDGEPAKGAVVRTPDEVKVRCGDDGAFDEEFVVWEGGALIRYGYGDAEGRFGASQDLQKHCAISNEDALRGSVQGLVCVLPRVAHSCDLSVSIQGFPARGARVHPVGSTLSAPVDAAGMIVLDVFANKPTRYIVRHPDCAPREVLLDFGTRHEAVELIRKVKANVQCIDWRGEPVPGALVVAREEMTARVLGTGISGERGIATLLVANPGSRFVVFAKGGANRGLHAESLITERWSGQDLELILQEACEVSGRIVDVDGEGLQGCRVVLQNPLRGRGDPTVTYSDASGGFAAVSSDVGWLECAAHLDGYVSVVQQINCGESAVVELVRAGWLSLVLVEKGEPYLESVVFRIGVYDENGYLSWPQRVERGGSLAHQIATANVGAGEICLVELQLPDGRKQMREFEVIEVAPHGVGLEWEIE